MNLQISGRQKYKNAWTLDQSSILISTAIGCQLFGGRIELTNPVTTYAALGHALCWRCRGRLAITRAAEEDDGGDGGRVCGVRPRPIGGQD